MPRHNLNPRYHGRTLAHTHLHIHASTPACAPKACMPHSQTGVATQEHRCAADVCVQRAHACTQHTRSPPAARWVARPRATQPTVAATLPHPLCFPGAPAIGHQAPGALAAPAAPEAGPLPARLQAGMCRLTWAWGPAPVRSLLAPSTRRAARCLPRCFPLPVPAPQAEGVCGSHGGPTRQGLHFFGGPTLLRTLPRCLLLSCCCLRTGGLPGKGCIC